MGWEPSPWGSGAVAVGGFAGVEEGPSSNEKLGSSRHLRFELGAFASGIAGFDLFSSLNVAIFLLFSVSSFFLASSNVWLPLAVPLTLFEAAESATVLGAASVRGLKGAERINCK